MLTSVFTVLPLRPHKRRRRVDPRGAAALPLWRGL